MTPFPNKRYQVGQVTLAGETQPQQQPSWGSSLLLWAWDPSHPPPFRDIWQPSLGKFFLSHRQNQEGLMGCPEAPYISTSIYIYICIYTYRPKYYNITKALKIIETTTHEHRPVPAWYIIISIDLEKAFGKIQQPFIVHLTKPNAYSWYKLSTS